MRQYVVFYKNMRPVCGTWVAEKNDELATEAAEFKLICMCPNVEYDSAMVVNWEV